MLAFLLDSRYGTLYCVLLYDIILYGALCFIVFCMILSDYNTEYFHCRCVLFVIYYWLSISYCSVFLLVIDLTVLLL